MRQQVLRPPRHGPALAGSGASARGATDSYCVNPTLLINGLRGERRLTSAFLYTDKGHPRPFPPTQGRGWRGRWETSAPDWRMGPQKSPS